MIVSPTIEEYLEQIYRLEEESGVARTKSIAERVGVRLGTVTNTIETLKQKQLITHKPYRGVKLTKGGRKIATEIIRRHRLAECLLVDFLKIGWSSAHDHACRFEHVITEELVKPIERALGHPTTCPHGNPIPKACGGILEEKSKSLIEINETEKRAVKKIVREEKELLKYLEHLHLIPGVSFEVVEKAPFDGPITLEIDGEKRSISRKTAALIWVSEEE